MATRNLHIPKLAAWLVRLIANPAVLRRVYQDPMVFACWYAMGVELLPWPQDAKAVQQAQRSKKLSLERSLRLLEQLNRGGVGKLLSLKEARLMLEGYAMHEWIVANWGDFAEMVQGAVLLFDTRFEKQMQEHESNTALRLWEFTKALKLCTIEEKVLYLAFTCSGAGEFRNLLSLLVKAKDVNVAELWCTMLDCSEGELHQAFSPAGILRTSRLIQSHGKDRQLPGISDFWIDILSNPLEDLFDSLLRPLVVTPGAGIAARMAEEDFSLAVEILRNGAQASQAGVNLLLYGAPVFEKRSLLGELLGKAEVSAYVLQDFDDAYGEWPSIAFVAQRALFDRHGTQAVLVLEKPGDVLERKAPVYLRTLLGIELDGSHIAPMDQLMLETNPAPTVWAGPGADNLIEEAVARFVFHAPLKKAGREERRTQMERMIASLKLTKATKTAILALEDVSARQLDSAVRASQLSGAQSKREREDALVRAVKRSLAALKRDTSPKAKECVTAYSLEFINHAGKFGPQQILRALKLRPKGSLCLYGPPGSGKTQFVEYLAQQLEQRLIIKRASDLLSKWVGDNEKNLAAMFQEAEAEEAILFLDEGDSFLRDRNLAQQSWEVTKVNELLQGMERFPGIFIVATNLFRGLDAAALRRFTFKMELRALSPEQRWTMFVSETGIRKTLADFTRSQKDGWKADLYQMHQLTAGDFATVKRQCILLGEALTPYQWIEQLQIECDVKCESQAQEECNGPAEPTGAKKPPNLVH